MKKILNRYRGILVFKILKTSTGNNLLKDLENKVKLYSKNKKKKIKNKVQPFMNNTKTKNDRNQRSISNSIKKMLFQTYMIFFA